MSISREVLAKYIKPGCQVIETGARWGMTAIKASELGADDYLGCEISEYHQTVAMQMLSEVLAGSQMTFYVSKKDSIYLLGGIIPNKVRPPVYTVVFLDAHTEKNSPVLDELDCISKWDPLPNVILIDDLRCMVGWSIERWAIDSRLAKMGYAISVEDGVAPNDILVGQR